MPINPPFSQRQLRVAEQVRHILSEAINRNGELEYAFGSDCSVSISEVRISPDLKHAHIYISNLLTDNCAEICKYLEEQSSYYKSILGREMNTKYTPNLRFKQDSIPDSAAKIEKLLSEISRNEPSM